MFMHAAVASVAFATTDQEITPLNVVKPNAAEKLQDKLSKMQDGGAGEPSPSLGASCLQRLACSVVGVARAACKIAAG